MNIDYDFSKRVFEIAHQLHCDPIDMLNTLQHPKVIPMVRGNVLAAEAARYITTFIDDDYIVGLSKINANQGNPDTDITIVDRHKLTRCFNVESKSSVRNSAKITVGGFAFQVKNHKSRSAIKDRDSKKDRYALAHCDIVISSPYNAILAGNKSKNFELKKKIAEHLMELGDYEDLSSFIKHVRTTSWVWAYPHDIAEKANPQWMQRGPWVTMNAQYKPSAPWHSLDELPAALRKLDKKTSSDIIHKQNDFFFAS